MAPALAEQTVKAWAEREKRTKLRGAKEEKRGTNTARTGDQQKPQNAVKKKKKKKKSNMTKG
jgi:hypothetical protein